MPFLVPIELASITPVLLMTESTTWRAAAAVSSTRPPLALSLPSLLTSELSGWPVATSLTCRGDLVVDAKRDQLVAVEVEREPVAGGERHRAEVAVMVPELRTPGATSAAKAAVARRDRAEIDDRGVGLPGIVKLYLPGHEVGVGDVVRGREEARRVHGRTRRRTGCRRD